jgi:hypothetical protein
MITLLQRMVADDVLTRVLGVLWGMAMGAVAIGSVAASLVVTAIGPRAAFAAVGVILPLLALVSYHRLVEIDTTAVPTLGLDLIDRVPMFAPFSIAMKERVAAALFPVSVPAGEVVIREGDAGDRFYIVSDGAFGIDAGGVRVAAGDGDYFGEIALLRDAPRSATVTATADAHLYALQREQFLAAVTGHSAAHAAGQRVAEARRARTGQSLDP